MASKASMIASEERKRLGRRGEEYAAAFFMRRGYAIVSRNWSCRYGELDLVIQKGEDLRVIEVKTRIGRRGPIGPHEAVSEEKLDKIWEAVAWFQEAHPELPEDVHVDVLSIVIASDGETPVFQWLKDFE